MLVSPLGRSGASNRIFRRLTVLAAVAALVAGMGAGSALAAPTPHQSGNQVIDGNARFEVLTPTLIRLEYAGDGAFQDGATFNVVNRNLPVPAFTTDVTSDGYREIRTAQLYLRYKENSGPFSQQNLSVQVQNGSNTVTATPYFPSSCAFGQLCQAEDAQLGGGASPADNHTGYTGSEFVAGWQQTGAAITEQVLNVPSAGTYQLSMRYANSTGGDGQTTTRTLSTVVNGKSGPVFQLPTTADWNTWTTASVNVALAAGTNTVEIQQSASDSGNVNVDSVAITPAGAAYPGPSTTTTDQPYGMGPSDTLGGWDRALDNPGTLPDPENPGILDRDGWYLLDDSHTALLNSNGTITDRPSHGGQPYQDGYFFGYGQNYLQGLHDLAAISGPSDLLPENAYGVWFSRYYPYTTSDYENTLIPAFRSHNTPIDYLVIDTDWKSPSQWDGWNWNASLFPDPQGFMNWTKQQGLSVSMNIHSSIDSGDPQFATANAQAGGLTNTGGTNYVWNWSSPQQLQSYFNLHQPFEQQGVREWWLDWCCDSSFVSDPNVTPDAFINAAYAADGNTKGERGYAFSRMGSSYQAGDNADFAAGPWSEHRSTLQFTGDTPASWQMLQFESEFTQDEAAAGQSQVTDDLGSFHGDHDPDDLYVRWLQMGAFQPVFRLHSDHGDRLPWDYDSAAEGPAEQFMNLRESLVPYTYTLAHDTQQAGTPMLQALYLDYPSQPAAYTNPDEYLYGSNVLVSPITSADNSDGNGQANVWFPPGTWTDYFTGRSYTGPSTVRITDTLSQMPVFVKSGGIVVQRTNQVPNDQSPLDQVTVDVAAGASGSYSMYEDAGEGFGYQQGQSATTQFSWNDATSTLSIGAAKGSYPGQIASRDYTLKLSDTTAPTSVTVDGTALPASAYSYDPATRTVTVSTGSVATNAAHTISLGTGGAPITGNGGCLDVRGGTNTDGTPVQVYGCNGTTAQNWTEPGDGTVRALGKCLDTNASGTAVLDTCDLNASQQWTARPDGTLYQPAASRCLDDPGSAGTQQELASCTAGAAAQHWQLPASPLYGNGGLCLDVRQASNADGTPVQLYTCNGTTAQSWAEPGDGTVRALGKCLDVPGTADGTLVDLSTCGGTASQQWVAQNDGSLLNSASGKCLDDPNANPESGLQLQVYDCNSTSAQVWTLP